MARRKANRKKSSKNFANALRRLKKLNARDQHQAIGMANNTFIRQLCTQLKKLKHAKLTPKSKKELRKHKKRLRQLLSPRIGMSKRRRLLTQGGGGFLKAILRQIPVLGTVIDVIDNV